MKRKDFPRYLLGFLEATAGRDTPGEVRKTDAIVGVLVLVKYGNVRPAVHSKIVHIVRTVNSND